jgi:hydrocephalus-inducing protein
MGESMRDTLVISSDKGGEYECPLVGRCVPQKPQGPIECGKGSGVVTFKNVFMQDAEFQYSIDNPAFTIGKVRRVDLFLVVALKPALHPNS